MQLRREWLGGLATCGIALGLTFVFWLPIWSGAGFVGGDIYSYFFPQKVIYSEALHSGELPLWNDRAGFGYPLLAESQTGIFYPPNVLLYRLLDPHSAFHACFLLHYFVSFVFASVAARRLGIGLLPSWLTALVYVYGWFPPRTCVEWAIIGGTWLPAALWCAEGLLSSRLWRYAIGLSGVLAVQLLAGHFQIAWFTLLLLAAYVPARVFWFGDHGHQLSAISHQPNTADQKPVFHPWRLTFVGYAAIACGLSLAAVQLLPTYELKVRSQRAAIGRDHELDFGAIPPWYWTQVFWPSHWYSPLTDRETAFRENPPLGHSRTNSAEAHLYFGVVPLLLVLIGIAGCTRRERVTQFWLVLAALSWLYTSGWLLPITRYLPGFNYFQGAGRYGLLTTFAVAMLAGITLDRFLREPEASRKSTVALLIGAVWSASVWFFLGDDVAAVVNQLQISNPLIVSTSKEAATNGPLLEFVRAGVLLTLIIAPLVALWWHSERASGADARFVLFGWLLLTTAVEFWTISRLVTFAPMIESPPLKLLAESPVRRTLLEAAKARPTLRLFAPGANLPSTLGVPSAPVYLTFGPAEYVDESLRLPVAEGTTNVPATREQLDWLRRVGVTHVMCFEPPAMTSAMKLVWKGDDPFLNRAWGRAGQPLFLYAIGDSLGRLQLLSANGERRELHSWQLTAFESRANAIKCEVEINEAGVLLLADLDYPGWSVTVDGRPAESLRVDGQFRGVRLDPGSHRVIWSYRPRFVLWGAMISLGTLLFLAAVAHVRFWHPGRLQWLEEAESSSAAPAR